MVECFLGAERMRTWALELENGGGREREKAWVKGVNLYPFIKVVNIKRLPTRPKNSPIPKSRADDTVGLPMPVLMRIPR